MSRWLGPITAVCDAFEVYVELMDVVENQAQLGPVPKKLPPRHTATRHHFFLLHLKISLNPSFAKFQLVKPRPRLRLHRLSVSLALPDHSRHTAHHIVGQRHARQSCGEPNRIDTKQGVGDQPNASENDKGAQRADATHKKGVCSESKCERATFAASSNIAGKQI